MNETRQQLLRTARRLFARRGYDGTSIRAITHQAKTNLGAVTYHFGSKRHLYEEVLRSVTEPLARRIEGAAALPVPAVDRIESILRSFFEHVRQVPDMPSLILRELALNRPVPVSVRQTMGSVYHHLHLSIEAGQRDGSVVAGDVRHLVIGIIAQPIYAALAQRPLREVIGVDLRDSAMHARLVDDVVLFVRRGLQPPKGPGHARP